MYAFSPLPLEVVADLRHEKQDRGLGGRTVLSLINAGPKEITAGKGSLIY